MTWTETTRANYERPFGRYASDLTDQEWELVAPFLPPIGQGLGEIHRKFTGMGPHLPHQNPHPQNRKPL